MGRGHLVVSRRAGESVLIGDDIEVTIVEIRSSQVRISVAAPKDVTVHRREIRERIDAQRLEAAE